LRTVRVGVIGCGKVAESFHVPAYQSAAGVEIVGLADSDKIRLDYLAKKFRIKRTFTDYKSLLESKEIDAVSVCVPTGLHHDIVVAAAENGKHVLCEKPLARSLAQGSEMMNAAKKGDVQLYVGFPSRFSVVVREGMKMLRRGIVKDPLSLSLRFLDPPAPPGSWYMNRAMGGGALFDTGSHGIDLLLHYFGDGKLNSIKFTRGAENCDVDVAAELSIGFSNNINAQFQIDWRSAARERTVTFSDKEASFRVDINGRKIQMMDRRKILGKYLENYTMHFEESVLPHWAEIWDFVSCVRGEGYRSPELATGEDGLRALSFIEEAYREFPNN